MVLQPQGLCPHNPDQGGGCITNPIVWGITFLPLPPNTELKLLQEDACNLPGSILKENPLSL